MHLFAIDVKGGESRGILPSITKGEIVGHRLSLMSIWQYSRKETEPKKSTQSQEEPRGAEVVKRCMKLLVNAAVAVKHC